MKKVDLKLHAGDVPKGYAVCYNNQCPRNKECLRYLCYTVLPESEDVCPAVLPQAWQGDECRKFVEARPVQLAWGMKRLFKDVPSWQSPVIRHELMDLFGSRTTYFRYRRGEFLITPKQQEQVAEIFQRYGITAPRCYDHTLQTYYFDVPGFGSSHAYTTKHTKQRLQTQERGFKKVP